MLYKPLLNNKKIKENIPNHIAIIMDGNRRWAKKRGKIYVLGYKKGFEAVKKTVKFAILNKIKILTLYAFSSENWNRPNLEVNALMDLFFLALKKEVKNLKKYNIKLKIIGDIKYFSKKLQHKINQAELVTSENNGLILNIAANYSGRWDIIQSVKKIIKNIQKGMLKIEEVEENMFSKYLSTTDLLPVDLVIRTGGEKRISNFLLWQIAYSELYFTNVLWPDFNQFVFQKAINSFMSRERRFGGSVNKSKNVF